LIEREEIVGPDYYPSDPPLQKWEHEEGLIFIGDQKVRVTRPRLRHVVHGEVPLKSYERLYTPGQFSEELLEKMHRGLSAQKYADTVINSAEAFGCRPPRSPASS
jgi:putative transposase